jgi:hypothetical protein
MRGVRRAMVQYTNTSGRGQMPQFVSIQDGFYTVALSFDRTQQIW